MCVSVLYVAVFFFFFLNMEVFISLCVCVCNLFYKKTEGYYACTVLVVGFVLFGCLFKGQNRADELDFFVSFPLWSLSVSSDCTTSFLHNALFFCLFVFLLR